MTNDVSDRSAVVAQLLHGATDMLSDDTLDLVARIWPDLRGAEWLRAIEIAIEIRALEEAERFGIAAGRLPAVPIQP